MPDLLASQRAFAAALRDTAQAVRLASMLRADDATAARRLAVYRGNVVASVARTLGMTYPVIQQIVGEEFFFGLARAYWKDTPSRSGDLHDYGAGFGDFLAGFEHAGEFPYLPDVARLEWAVHRACCAADAPAFDPASLAQMAAEQQGQVVLQWAPGTTLVSSVFPIVRIWTIHQTDFDGEFGVDWDQSETALVARDGLQVKVTALASGEAALLTRLLTGVHLEAALADAIAAQGAGAADALSRWITQGPVCGFHLATLESPYKT